MIEFLKHLFGFCGDSWHPNIFHLIMGAPTVSYMIYKIKTFFSYGKKRKERI
jgi:hypothetical protein